MAAGKLEVIVSAKIDELQEGLTRVEASVAETRAKVSKLDSTMSRFQSTAMKATKSLGALALVGVGVQEAFNSVTRTAMLSSAGLSLLTGNTTEAMKTLEKFGDSIREIPILGSVLGGMADSAFDMIDFFAGMTKEAERLEKQLQKTFVSLAITGQARELQKQNELLVTQLNLARELNDNRKIDLQLEIDLVNLAEQQARRRVEITKHGREDAEATRVALEQLEANTALQEDILRAKANQAKVQIGIAEAAERAAEAEERKLDNLRKQQALDAFEEQVTGSERLIKQLQREAKILSETDELKRAGLKHQDELIKLHERTLEAEEAIRKNNELTAAQKVELLNLLDREFKAAKQILDIEAEQTENAIKRAREEEKINALKERQREVVKQLEADNVASQSRLGEISNRLGSAATQMKSGLTETANTAMGSFTFGEADAQEKIRTLNKEQTDIQREIERRSARIEQLLEQISGDFGVQ